MRTKSMKSLMKMYDLNSDIEYYEMIVESVINGQRTQAKEFFNKMPKENKKSFLKIAVSEEWRVNIKMFIDEL
jgi:hypothetical protein